MTVQESGTASHTPTIYHTPTPYCLVCPEAQVGLQKRGCSVVYCRMHRRLLAAVPHAAREGGGWVQRFGPVRTRSQPVQDHTPGLQRSTYMRASPQNMIDAYKMLHHMNCTTPRHANITMPPNPPHCTQIKMIMPVPFRGENAMHARRAGTSSSGRRRCRPAPLAAQV